MKDARNVDGSFCNGAKAGSVSPIFAIVASWKKALNCYSAPPSANVPCVAKCYSAGIERIIGIAKLELNFGRVFVHFGILVEGHHVNAGV